MGYHEGEDCSGETSTAFPFGPFGGYKFNFGFGGPGGYKQYLDKAATLNLGIGNYTKPIWLSGPILSDSGGACYLPASQCSKLYCSHDNSYKNTAIYNAITGQYVTFVRDVAGQIKNHPNLTAVTITHGLDGESRCKPETCGTVWPDGTTVPDPCAGYNDYRQAVTAAFYKNFCNGTYDQNTGFCQGTMIPLFYQENSWGDAAGQLGKYMPPMGLKFSGFVADTTGVSYGQQWRGWGTIDTYVRYRNLIPFSVEPKYGNWFLDNRNETEGQGTYWWNLEALWLRPTFMDINPSYGLRWSKEQDPEYIDFLNSHLGVTAETTPDVWIALRDSPDVCGAKTVAEFEKNPCLYLYSGQSGKRGDYDFFLRRPDNIPGNKTMVMSRPDVYSTLEDYLNIDPIKYYNQEIPYAAWKNKYGRHIRRTMKENGNFYMSFDVDNDYPWSFKPGKDFEATVIFFDKGSGPFYLQYKDPQGQLTQKEIQRNNTKTWKVEKITLDNAYFNDSMGGGTNANGNPTYTDFRIYNGGTDHPNVYLHMIKIKGLGENPGSYKKTTQITCSLPTESVFQDDTPKLQAKLTDRAGTLLNGKNIRISINPYAYTHRVFYAQTGSNGMVEKNLETTNLSLHFQANRDAHEVEVVFPGDSEYLASSTTCYFPLSIKNRTDMQRRTISVTLSKNQVHVGDQVTVTVNTNGNGDFAVEGEGFGQPACTGAMGTGNNSCSFKIGGMAIPGRRNIGIILGWGSPYAAVAANIPITVLGGEDPEVPSPTPSPCLRGELGNLNCDTEGRINGTDLDILLALWGTSGTTSIAERHSADIAPDPTDGTVNAQDLDRLLANWGTI